MDADLTPEERLNLLLELVERHRLVSFSSTSGRAPGGGSFRT